ncbi:MAG TPA: DegT/DnrJ/EryC1/StrS family aminotransferase [Polyangiaceae bacterium]|jgi:dTDP-4-amino-4,6-dideoxygalactose transaminase|nr:DegT/DnrJ/EryC1/StrS family aminotransferase [Polyangiaceae bacterium]
MTSRVPLVDLKAQHALLAGELADAIGAVVASSELVLGPAVDRFEEAAAGFLGVKHAIGVSCGSDALVTALLAAGVRHGDEVVTTPFTFFATAEAILRVGAVPRFADVEPRSLQLDAGAVAGVLSARTRAIMPVHLFGAAAPIDALVALATRSGVAVVEDAAQAFGATLGGRALGTFGALGCYSFFPSKVLGALGDGGLVVTNDAALASLCRSLRQHGRDASGDFTTVGGNFRLDAVQAAALSVKLRRLPAFIEARLRHAALYDAALEGAPGFRIVERHAGWNGAIYTLRVLDGRRDAVRRKLHEQGVETGVYYARPLHLTGALAGHGVREGALPESERASREVLSLPLYPEMSDAQRDHVVTTLLAV